MKPVLSPVAGREARLLILGTAAGIALAAAGLLAPGANAGRLLATTAIARVNGEVVRIEDYQQVLNGLAQDRRDGLDPTQRQGVLDRLIDEELLVQRGLELGMARHDTKVRKDLTAAVIESVVAEFADTQPSDAELQAFYEQRRDFFAGPGRLHVRQVFCRVPTNADATMALERAQQATQRLRAGEDVATVRAALGDTELAPLPDALLPPAKLVDYLGPTAARSALALEVGAVSEPVRSNTGYHVLQAVDRQPDTSRSLEEIKPQVLAEFRRRGGEHALRAYLDDLRARAEITVAPQLP